MAFRTARGFRSGFLFVPLAIHGEVLFPAVFSAPTFEKEQMFRDAFTIANIGDFSLLIWAALCSTIFIDCLLFFILRDRCVVNKLCNFVT